ncbi:MAG: PAS domain S-box protein [Candidatus Omnitrophica bacterium]|jgi:diguanylate cyclase (GGDEF)-like protein/PAS domain S-box-containing protein|nr:PAS domain S-box protein [Candidatus Omnitrophota bacterium]
MSKTKQNELLKKNPQDFSIDNLVYKKLRSAQLQQAAILNNIPDIAWLKDKESRFIAVNEAFVKFFGLSAESIIGKTDFDICPKELAKKYQLDDQEVLRAAKRLSFEERLSDKNGNSIVIETIKGPVLNDAGEVIGTAGIARDITERKKNEERLREVRSELEIRVKVRTAELTRSNDDLLKEIKAHKSTEHKLLEASQHYRLLFDSNPLPMGVYDLENLRFLAVNEAAIKYYGYSQEEFLQMTLIDLCLKEDIPAVHKAVSQLTDGIDRSGVWRQVKKDGSVFYADIISHKMEFQGKRADLILANDVTDKQKIETDLINSERFLANVFSSIQDGIGVLDTEMNVLRVNPVMNEWFKYNKPLEGKKCFLAYHNRQAPCEVCSVLETLKTHKAAAEIIPRHNKDGKQIGFFELYSYPMFDEKTNQLSGVIEYVRDITEKKWTEDKIKSAEERYRISTEQTGQLIYDWDINSGKILWSGPIKDITGYTFEEFAGVDIKRWEGMIHPDDRKSSADELTVAVRAKKLFETEYRFQKKDGSYIYIRDRGTFLIDANDNPYRMLGCMEDISGRRFIESVLRFEAERTKKYLEVAGVIFLLINTNGEVTLINRKGCEVLGYKQEYVIGKLWVDNFIPENNRKALKSFMRKIMQGELADFEYNENPVLTANGKKRLIAWHNSLLFDDNGKVIYLISSGEDITERKAIEQQREKLNQELLKSNDKLKQVSLIDQHTGLFNHNYLQQAAEAEFQRSRRYAHPLSVILLDIDYFKSINDLYGISFGDLVLKQFASELKRMLRKYDIVIRYSGEEFLIISPGISSQQALNLAQRLLETLSFLNFGNKEHQVKLKLSLGVVSFPDDKAGKGMDLINLAEQIMTKAKESGGNRAYSSADMKKRFRIGKISKSKLASVNLLKNKIDKLTRKTNQDSMESIFAFAKALELKDHYTGEHVEKTVHFASEIAKGLGLPKDELEAIQQAAMLHDLGKIGVSENILLKKGKLNKLEFEEIRKHPQIGADIIRPIRFLHGIIPFIFYHHERWDGKGYPAGIKGDDIPMGARVIAIADVYQALSSDRPYHRAFSKKEAMAIIKNGAGTQFDPRIVNVFIKVMKKEKKHPRKA